jgi:hypothetical protein
LGYPAVPEPLSCLPTHHRDNAANIIYIDDDFEDLLIIPAPIFGELKSKSLLNDGSLILQVYIMALMLGLNYLYQDKASLYGPKHLEVIIKHGMHVIDARAGCGCLILI